MALFPSILTLENLELDVHLGVPDSERMHKQKVLVTMTFYFYQPPAYALNDQTDRFICYEEISRELMTYVSVRSIHLIEYLAHQLHAQVRDYITRTKGERAANVKLRLDVYKPHLSVDFVVGGARYSYSDVVDDASQKDT